MELRHLRYFVAVGEEQHFGRAAARLHVAQPPLSRQIQDLEREIGFPLLDRLPRGVRLSAAGSLFLNDARRILQDVEDAKRRAERVALGKAGTLRIGIATAVSWHGMVAETFREFRRRQPDVELVVHHLLSLHQIEAVLSGRLDAGFAASMTPWHKELAHSQFAEDQDAARGAQGSSPGQARTDSVTGSAGHAVHLVSALGQSARSMIR